MKLQNHFVIWPYGTEISTYTAKFQPTNELNHFQHCVKPIVRNFGDPIYYNNLWYSSVCVEKEHKLHEKLMKHTIVQTNTTLHWLCKRAYKTTDTPVWKRKTFDVITAVLLVKTHFTTNIHTYTCTNTSTAKRKKKQSNKEDDVSYSTSTVLLTTFDNN